MGRVAARGLVVLLGLGASPVGIGSCGARTGLESLAIPSTTCVVKRAKADAGDARDAGDPTCGGATTVSGVVYDPAAKRPLYNVVVYVPSSTPDPLPSGASCASCDSLYTGGPIVAAVTDADGHFVLSSVPAGTDVPLVLQIGKWRRQLVLPSVVACQDNPQPDGTLRLPRNRSEGDLPSIAISTGGADTLECIFRRVGIDASEYVGGAGGTGSIHVFQGTQIAGAGGMFHPPPNTSPPAPSSRAALWDSAADIAPYDMVFLSCEGAETGGMNQQVLFDYAASGGRVFASHFHYAWFDTGPFGAANLATWSPGGSAIADIDAVIETTLANGQAFPQGAALAQWLGANGALTNGELPIEAARHNANVSASNTPSTAWIVADGNSHAPGATQFFTFATPLGAPAADQCGQVVYTDLHVGAASGDDPTLPVPEECADHALSPQETALEFMLFDLASCVTPPGQAPAPPFTCTVVEE